MPDKWLQSIIDDIKAANDKAWCHCGPTGAVVAVVAAAFRLPPSGHWVIVLCDCESGSIRMSDDQGNCIPFCEGCVGPFGYNINVLGPSPMVVSSNRCRLLQRE